MTHLVTGIASTRIKFYKKSGARLYIPESLIRAPGFPFEDDDLVKIEMDEGGLRISRPEWWELLDWNEMREAYSILPREMREKIAEKGLAPRPVVESVIDEAGKEKIPAA